MARTIKKTINEHPRHLESGEVVPVSEHTRTYNVRQASDGSDKPLLSENNNSFGYDLDLWNALTQGDWKIGIELIESQKPSKEVIKRIITDVFTTPEVYEAIKKNYLNQNRINILRVGDIIFIKDNNEFSLNRFGVLYIYENQKWTPFIFSRFRENIKKDESFDLNITEYLRKYLLEKLQFKTRPNRNDLEYYTTAENYKKVKGTIIKL